jgi:hypothetical protein
LEMLKWFKFFLHYSNLFFTCNYNNYYLLLIILKSFSFQTLPDEFGFFLISNRFERIILCADYDRTQAFEVMTTSDPFTIKLGQYPWNQFCLLNNFMAGETIRFKFSIVDPHKRCHVFKATDNGF